MTTPRPEALTADPWTLLHDNDFTWDDVNAIAAVFGHHGYEVVRETTTPDDWTASEAGVLGSDDGDG